MPSIWTALGKIWLPAQRINPVIKRFRIRHMTIPPYFLMWILANYNPPPPLNVKYQNIFAEKSRECYLLDSMKLLSISRKISASSIVSSKTMAIYGKLDGASGNWLFFVLD